MPCHSIAPKQFLNGPNYFGPFGLVQNLLNMDQSASITMDLKY